MGGMCFSRCNTQHTYIPWNPVRELLHSVGSAPSARFADEWFRKPMGCGLAAKSSPRPSVVPDTLSGPGRLDAGSHVNLYGRAVGTCSGERCTGEFAREGTEEMSDMDGRR